LEPVRRPFDVKADRMLFAFRTEHRRHGQTVLDSRTCTQRRTPDGAAFQPSLVRAVFYTHSRHLSICGARGAHPPQSNPLGGAFSFLGCSSGTFLLAPNSKSRRVFARGPLDRTGALLRLQTQLPSRS